MPTTKKKKELEIETEENILENNNNELLCKYIQSNINNLSQDELYEIFKILYNNNSNYTKNNNGIFVNLNWLDRNILLKIYNYINFCIKSHKEIKKHEIMKNLYNENLNKSKNKIKKEEIYNENNIVINEENTINNTKNINKISSSMKFYLFKKKFLKKQITTNNNNCNTLIYEKYLIKK